MAKTQGAPVVSFEPAGELKIGQVGMHTSQRFVVPQWLFPAQVPGRYTGGRVEPEQAAEQGVGLGRGRRGP